MVTCSLKGHPAAILEVALFQRFWSGQSENRGRLRDVTSGAERRLESLPSWLGGRENVEDPSLTTQVGDPSFMTQGQKERDPAFVGYLGAQNKLVCT